MVRSREERLFIQNNFAAQGAMRNLQDVQHCLLQYFKLFVTHKVLYEAALEECLVLPRGPGDKPVEQMTDGREAALFLTATTFFDRSTATGDVSESQQQPMVEGESPSPSTAHATSSSNRSFPPIPVLPLPRFVSLVDRVAVLLGKERRGQSAPADAVRSSLADLRALHLQRRPSSSSSTSMAVADPTTTATTTAAVSSHLHHSINEQLHSSINSLPPPTTLAPLSATTTTANGHTTNDVDQFLHQFGLSVRGSETMDGIDTIDMLAEMVAYDMEDGGNDGGGGEDPFAAMGQRHALQPKKLERHGSRRLLQLALVARLSTTPLTSARRGTARGGTAIALATSHTLQTAAATAAAAAALAAASVGPPPCWTKPTFDSKGKGLHHDIFIHDAPPTEHETAAHLARLRTLQPRRAHSSQEGVRTFPRTVAERLRLPPLTDEEKQTLPPPTRSPHRSSPPLNPQQPHQTQPKRRAKSPTPIDFDAFVQETYRQARENGVSTTHMDLVVKRRNAQLRKAERDKRIESRKEELRKGFVLGR